MKCPKCTVDGMAGTVVPHSLMVGKRVFVGAIPAMKCSNCRESYLNGESLEMFEVRAAADLVRAGEFNKDSFRFMRKTLGLMAKELADLLALDAANISRIENGKMKIQPSTAALLGTLVLGKELGHSDALIAIRAVQSPTRLPRRVEIFLEGDPLADFARASQSTTSTRPRRRLRAGLRDG